MALGLALALAALTAWAGSRTVGGGLPAGPMGGLASGHELDVPGDLERVASVAPGGYLRSDFAWWWVQPDGPSAYDWSGPDERIEATRAAGLQTLALLAYTPEWANGGGSDKRPPTPDKVDDWERYCYEFAKRYVPRGVVTFELWNEPNVDQFWEPTPDAEDYVDRVLRPGAAGIRRAAAELDADVVVLGGSTAPASDGPGSIAPSTFLEGIYGAGGGPSFDALAHHPYVWPQEPRAGADDALARTADLREEMVRNGDEEKRVWATEVGLPSRTEGPHHPGPGNDRFVSHQAYADRIPRTFDLWFGLDDEDDQEWVGPLLWFSIRNLEGEQEGRLEDPEHGFGFVFDDGSDKPSEPTPREALRDAFATHRGR